MGIGYGTRRGSLPDVAGGVAGAGSPDCAEAWREHSVRPERSVAVARPPAVAVIVNPISGTGGSAAAIRRRAERAAGLVASGGRHVEMFVTERQGHARELAEAALTRGTPLVVAWGGDGTVNEVASALAFTSASLGIVPGGSGNGLARELGIPHDPRAAFDRALRGQARRIDAGELDGRLFFNVAGCGLDARVARVFADNVLARRGFARYLQIAAREVLRFDPDEYQITAAGFSTRSRALIVAFANARQYGNGALIAPSARVDDGEIDLVVVGHRSPWSVLVQAPRLFLGQISRVPDVTTMRVREVEVTAERALLCHVDGEPHLAGPSVTVRVRPGALVVSC